MGSDVAVRRLQPTERREKAMSIKKREMVERVIVLADLPTQDLADALHDALADGCRTEAEHDRRLDDLVRALGGEPQ